MAIISPTPLIDAAIFREYDIRGIVDVSLTIDTVTSIGKALGSIAQEQGIREFAIARDGRLSGPKLVAALAAGLRETGCHVVDLGMVPTPILYFATHTIPDRSGIMVTGSHNPANYNGLKIVLDGKTFAGVEIQQLYQRICQEQFVTGEATYGDYRVLDLRQAYIEKIQQSIHLSRPLKVVIDAGNGVTGEIAPHCFEELGCDVETLFCDIDGHFPNHHPDPGDPTNLQDLIARVKATKADVGLAFDGDGDRLGVVTPKGEVIFPDRLLMLFAETLLRERPASTIIFDVKCTDQLMAHIKQHHGHPIMWKTGHSMIKAKIAETKAALAGEMSGHFFFNDRWYGFDDALYAGARLLEILSQCSQDCDALFAAYPISINTPELKIPVKEEEKFSLMKKLIATASFTEAKEILTIDGLRVSFGEGWGLVRPSNTTPYLILRFEAMNRIFMQHIQTLFRQWLLAVKPDLVLPF